MEVDIYSIYTMPSISIVGVWEEIKIIVNKNSCRFSNRLLLSPEKKFFLSLWKVEVKLIEASEAWGGGSLLLVQVSLRRVSECEWGSDSEMRKWIKIHSLCITYSSISVAKLWTTLTFKVDWDYSFISLYQSE